MSERQLQELGLLRSGIRFNRQRQKNEKPQVKNLTVLVFHFSFLIVHAFLPAEAATPVLGVIRSPENAAQWDGISRRLNLSGAAYCVVDLPQVQKAADLARTRVLFLPNVETLTPPQIQALQEWMRQGGRVIVSGPVGSLSQPEVRSQLRSMLGAYWGFSLTTPATLNPVRNKTQKFGSQNGLSGTVSGGVVIPAGLNSQTIAVWKSSDNPPAVVITDKSIFLGWRWGVDAASTTELDAAWLRAALSSYGQTSSATPTPSDGTQQLCNPPPSAGTTLKPQTSPRQSPTWPEQAPISQNTTPPVGSSTAVDRQPEPQPSPTASSVTQLTDANADGLVAPPGLVVKPGSLPITGLQATAMRRELEDLLGRFESAQLAANSSPVEVSQQEPPAQNPQSKIQIHPSTLSRQNSALSNARAGLQKFLQLINQQDYAGARQQWLQARRILWDNYPTDRLRSQSEIRAMWLDRGTIIRAGSEPELAKIFDRLKAAGFNTVFFETVNAGYPIYPSRVAPKQNPLVQGWDPLQSAVKLAHDRGMELHAWVWIFAVGNQRHNALVKLPAPYPGPLIEAHPDWAGYDHQGRLFHLGSGKTFLDPANPEARRFLFQLLAEIVKNYQVDGVQLDYIRYPFQDPSAGYAFGYGTAARQQFQQLYGVDPTKISPRDRELWQKWTEFRTQLIDTFVAEASRRLRALQPKLILSAAVFPFPENERLQKLQQHWEVWAKRGDIDLLVPMTYALDTNKLQSLVQPWLESDQLGSTLVLPSIRLLNVPDIVVVDQIEALRNLPSSGYSLFAAENLNTNLQGIFSRIQGQLSQKPEEPLPFRQPFQAASARYAALQREWSFLAATNQLWMREPALSEWRKQAETLSAVLTQLAESPSVEQLMVAKKSLTTFQSQFKTRMQLHALEQPYQVRVWENRLATLEGLLRYGERTLNNEKGFSQSGIDFSAEAKSATVADFH